MRWITDVLYRLKAIIAPGRMQRDLDDEVTFHLEMETKKNRERGMSEEEARRQALRSFGGVLRQKERARESWGVSFVQNLKGDARYALRQLGRNPTFAAVVVLTLALGIGATTAIFSVVNGVLLRPLPYESPDRLVAVWSQFLPESGYDLPQFGVSPPEYFDYREASSALEDVAAYFTNTLTLSGGDGTPESISAAQVTWNLFAVLGEPSGVGRTFVEEDDLPGASRSAVLSSSLWRRRFGGDPGIIGRTILIDGRQVEVVGVARPRFNFPDPAVQASTSTYNF